MSRSLTTLIASSHKLSGRRASSTLSFANAGITTITPFGNITEEDYDSIFNINVKGVLFTVQQGASVNAGQCLNHPECVHRRQ
jgi:NAD(P)-dependent dehydrogenase (short-subunit alcohol dehydrogenase family)